MLTDLTEAGKAAFKRAAKLLTGAKKRKYIAEITRDFLNGNTRKAEREFGWGRNTVKKGLRELETGLVCFDNYSARGNRKTEDKNLKLVADIAIIVDPESQTDPDFKNNFRYTRMTASAVRKLLKEKGWSEDELPTKNTIGNMLNRMGYRIRSVDKAKPLKKIPETDMIFENTNQANLEADEDNQTIRISIDVKAKVNIGDFSRGGKSRGSESTKALDHDTNPDKKLVPVGILEPDTGASTIIFGTSVETSDLIVDCLELWWKNNKERFAGIKTLLINSDNGPHVQSHRTWFIKRIEDKVF